LRNSPYIKKLQKLSLAGPPPYNQQKLSMLNVFPKKKKVIKEKISIIDLFVSTRKISKHPAIC
jgi:hypothetical protein